MEEINVCRTCLRATKKFVSIFSAPELWGKKIVLAKLIMACAPVVIKIGDGLSTKICDNCLQLLQLSFLFRLRVITANEHFKDAIRSQIEPTPLLQLATNKQTTNLNQIYSTDYIFESIYENNQSSCNIAEAIKQEPLDIKEEITDKINEDALSTSSVENNNFTIKSTTSLDRNSVAQNQQEIRSNQENQKINTEKKVTCQEENEPETGSNYNKLHNNSKTIKSVQAKRNLHNSSDKLELSFPTVVNPRLVPIASQNVIIGNEEQIDNELNFKLINNKQRKKRTFSNVDNSKKLFSVSKIPKLQDKVKISLPTDLETDYKQSNNSKNTVMHNSKFNTNNNECIIIDD